jgi:predicted nucleic acid-binding protein
MSIGPRDLLLLDTTILVHWVRKDRTGLFLKNTYALHDRAERPLFSTISEGEILGLAKCWKWGQPKLGALGTLINELIRFEASLPEVTEAYSILYYEDQRLGKCTGENDLWIAACALAAGATLLTCDRDFLWLSPTHLRVEFIPEIS